MKKFKHHFCSLRCAHDWNKKHSPRGENSPFWKEKVIITCSFCGKEYTTYIAWIRKNKTHFCSKECFFKWKHENTPKGKDNPLWNSVLTNCDSCNKPIYLPKNRLKNSKYHFCSHRCMGEWRRKTQVGEKNANWSGGKFPYYGGEYWHTQKRKILKRANHVSEMSGNNGGKMETHHIIPIRKFIQKYIDLCLFDIPSINLLSFKVLPYDLIPFLIFKEANSEENLIHLTQPEHTEFEGMPPTFFEAIRDANKDL